ncbi:MAG: bifunctional 4-hydroxy-2-oxoglutarate aldolase/2-dehydro-3-deoxy-phosphogluconate aldolase [Xanthomonadaceae bacterium]|nr:bifunctional 4-hydroxy-2-oxoglutarate aldolase/2-dehydro-3-deoxy-phosphogluconate aldolase [Xanthomonadaceae bacterium]MDE2178253.1 bifunctional 4-hydroxy-2-oxoglutarate aldolase/2-dehydro-3-deoxy-phosphogluconate aldolase [Xanthomonadaceae bacterium]MDE2246306.1 bifunctional 4-hydroxy-2-oxoglutarate aldolase/2-dehydro-3-deoxy-phosphogluconate aldolase [Xanthomonadaceae bacterium]
MSDTGTHDPQHGLEAILRRGPVMPVVVIDDAAQALPLARALLAGGIRSIEITLRTPAALGAIRAIAAGVDGMAVGAGTVLSPADLEAAARAGAHFAVSPGSTPALRAATADRALPWLPGAATASEVMALREAGYRLQKFFPAAAAGGVALLRSLHGPLPDVRFCPTGGISAETAPDWLALSDVVCVGGSWLTPADRLRAADWRAIEALARQAVALRRS